MRITKIVLFFLVMAAISSLNVALTQEQDKIIFQDIEVEAGDTLWSISNYYLKDPQAWPEILKYNKIPSSDPTVTLPGMTLKVPLLMVKEELRPIKLVYILNQVKYKHKNEMGWGDAKLNMPLYNEDTLRTMEKSRANAQFLTGEIVQLGEQSLVILRSEKKQDEVQLFSGNVRASKAKVLTDTAVINPKSSKSDYKTRIKPDKTTLVEVFEGIVDVTAQGKTVTLEKGFGTQIKYMNPPDKPVPLPELPKFKTDTNRSVNRKEADAPALEKEYTVRDVFSVNLELPPAAKITDDKSQAKILSSDKRQYHLQVAKDIDFKTIVLEETDTLKGNINLDLTKRKLPDGIYYFRMSYLDELGFESAFSKPKKMTIDTGLPKIKIIKPKEGEKIQDQFIHIEGETGSNLRLKVNDKDISSDTEGNFSTALLAKNGKNIISISLWDKTGSSTTAVRTVYCEEKTTIKVEDKDDVSGSKWTKTPTGVGMFIVTFMVIIGVLSLIFKR